MDLFEKAVSTKLEDVFVPEVFSSFCILIGILIFAIILHFKFKKASKDPLGEQKGLVLIVSYYHQFIENFVVGIMGERGRGFTSYFAFLGVYLFVSFAWGLIGFSSPMTYFGVTLSVALVTFLLIHITAIRENKFRYFKRYIEPIPVFLPINLISMWAPLLSLSLRMFGNALSGTCVMAIVYFGTKSLSNLIFGSLFIGDYWANVAGGVASGPYGPAGVILAQPIPVVLHLYFDLFSAFIQTFVFMLLSAIFISQEMKDEDAVLEKASVNE